MNKILLTILLFVGVVSISAQGIGGEIRSPMSSKRTNPSTSPVGKKSVNTRKGTTAKRTNVSNDPDYFYEKACEYWQKEKYTEAAKWMKKAAEKDYLMAQFMLGYMYEKEIGVDMDLDMAEKWYKLSIPQLYKIGIDNIKEDGNTSVNCFGFIKETGYYPYYLWAYYQLGAIYYWGNGGISIDYEDAVKYFQQAADEGSRPCLYYLGLCYKNGRGVQKDLSKANEYFNLSGYKDLPTRFYSLDDNGIWEPWNGYYKHTESGGAIYEGDFHNGRYNGNGTMIWPNGDKYVGQYSDGVRHGKGTYYWANGEKYEGDWVNGSRIGKGTYLWPNGQKYEGEFINGRITGNGVMTYPSKNFYVGNFENGYRHGEGTMYYYKERTYEKGIWKDNSLKKKSDKGKW